MNRIVCVGFLCAAFTVCNCGDDGGGGAGAGGASGAGGTGGNAKSVVGAWFPADGACPSSKDHGVQFRADGTWEEIALGPNAGQFCLLGGSSWTGSYSWNPDTSQLKGDAKNSYDASFVFDGTFVVTCGADGCHAQAGFEAGSFWMNEGGQWCSKPTLTSAGACP